MEDIDDDDDDDDEELRQFGAEPGPQCLSFSIKTHQDVSYSWTLCVCLCGFYYVFRYHYEHIGCSLPRCYIYIFSLSSLFLFFARFVSIIIYGSVQ